MVGKSGSRERAVPAYDLFEVRAALERGRFRLTMRVAGHLAGLGVDRREMLGILRSLGHRSFYKSQELAGCTDVWADVYRPFWGGRSWYIKYVREFEGDEYSVLTFCRDGESH